MKDDTENKEQQPPGWVCIECGERYQKQLPADITDGPVCADCFYDDGK